MKRLTILVVGLGLWLTAAPVQGQVAFGPLLAWGDDSDVGVGGRVDFGLGDALGIDEGAFQNLFGSAGATYFFTDCTPGFDFDEVDCSWFEINGNLGVPFTIEDSSIAPYAGTGLHLARVSVDHPGTAFDNDDTEVGLNLFGGISFPISDLAGFVEGKFELAGGEQFVLSTGIMFGG